MDKMAEFKGQSKEELKALYRDLSKEIFDMKTEISIARKIEKPHLVRLKKRTRARILTALSQKGEKVRYEG
ncbi:MAG TPA: 50S ribosomal protein L29 [Rhabdochlamydiaceae bacterium]|nr:50S ribosomal protein L29 [Rhabdochlamydiaceae bacterium]